MGYFPKWDKMNFGCMGNRSIPLQIPVKCPIANNFVRIGNAMI